jgi:sulfonate transport system substrate-binding protein
MIKTRPGIPVLPLSLLFPLALLLLQGCSPAEEAVPPASQAAAALPMTPAPTAMPELAPISVSGSYWIELSPVITAATSFYPVQLPMGEGGITRITSGDADLATNAETQLLRETLVNPDLRIIATVTESFYRLVGRRSAGIETLADIKGKRVMLPANTSANYYLVAMLRTVGLTEDDVEILPLPPAEGDQTGMDRMSDALAAGETDVISIWEPEPDDAIKQLGDDAIVFQDRSVYREVFNLHARATDLANPEKRRAIVEFMRALIRATEALKTNPEPYWPRVTEVTGFTHEEIEGGWPEMEFPVDIIPDMLDVLETEDVWVAKERDRAPRSREELAQFIDRSVVEEARAGF